MSPLPNKIKNVQAPKRNKTPVWKGPEEDGVTFSLLSRFLSCRERCRLYVVEGLKAAEGFNHRLEYGNMWHKCEEAFAAGTPSRRWENELHDLCRDLAGKYRFDQDKIDHWYNVCKTQFPIYIEYWKKHPEVVQQTPVFQEKVFTVPYQLTSGRVVKLRGKWDGLDIIGKGKSAALYLFETKTKGDVDELAMQRQLRMDLQTMMYIVALTTKQNGKVEMGEYYPGFETHPVKGVRYNVVRRPLSGGKHNIKRHQPSKSQPYGESKEDYYKRLGGLIAEEPGHYFMRWTVDVAPGDVERFRQRVLDPILEQLCDWWGWIGICDDDPFRMPAGMGRHWQHPFGVRNPIDEGYATDLDEYLENGSETGLARVENLFPELQ